MFKNLNWALGEMSKNEFEKCSYPVDPSNPAEATRVITTLAIDLDSSDIRLKTFLTSSSPFKWLSNTSFMGTWQTVSLLDIFFFNESGKYLKQWWHISELNSMLNLIWSGRRLKKRILFRGHIKLIDWRMLCAIWLSEEHCIEFQNVVVNF